MNDTHGVAGKGWHGFDLDGTLAVYDKWEGIDHIGEPVKPMVDLIRKMHEDGEVVKILTARVSPRPKTEMKPNPHQAAGGPYCVPAYADDYHAKALAQDGFVCESALVFYKKAEWTARDFVADWCVKNLGFLPEITHEKDHLMLDLYDDRVKQVVPNKGILVEDICHTTTDARFGLFDRAFLSSITWGIIAYGVVVLVLAAIGRIFK